MDSYRSVLNRFDTTQTSWEGWNHIAFILILLKKIRKRENLNGANGKEHIECSLRTIGIAKSRNTVVSSVEHQVFELMTFIYKEVVNTHHLEVHRIILAFGDTILYLV